MLQMAFPQAGKEGTLVRDRGLAKGNKSAQNKYPPALKPGTNQL